MKKIISIIFLTLILVSCASTFGTASLGSRVKRLELGMTKQEVCGILGNAYDLIGSGFTQEGREETLKYYGLNGPNYIFHFVENTLVEFYKEQAQQPLQQNVTIIKEE